MIDGAHLIIYTSDAEADRAFFRDVLEWPAVDAGHGWLIFRTPPAELAFHPTDGDPTHELMLMCDDLTETMAALATRGVQFSEPVRRERWGTVTTLRLPGGTHLALYEPHHPRAHDH
jgi:catechol 2,3-dioxygenase-like lactoylglutathione lyase family enzyme